MTARVGDTLNFSPAAQKIALRRHVAAMRRKVGSAARQRAARAATRKLLRCRCWQRARRVGLFVAYRDELPTQALLQAAWQQGKQVYVPKIHAGRMRFARLSRLSATRRNRHGIPEPAQAVYIGAQRLDMVLLPLTAFDARGARLGTGGGYYDRCLAAHAARRQPLRIGWAYAFQQQNEIPTEPWDLRLHRVCTDAGLMRFQ